MIHDLINVHGGERRHLFLKLNHLKKYPLHLLLPFAHSINYPTSQSSTFIVAYKSLEIHLIFHCRTSQKQFGAKRRARLSHPEVVKTHSLEGSKPHSPRRMVETRQQMAKGPDLVHEWNPSKKLSEMPPQMAGGPDPVIGRIS